MGKRICSVDECDKLAQCRGWCSTHYTRWLKHGDPLIKKRTGVPARPKPPCSIEGCGAPVVGRGWCGKHYQAWRRCGDPLATVPTPLVDRFWPRVDKDGPISEYCPHLGSCWVWTGGRSSGYGRIGQAGRGSPILYTHRFVYELCVGPIPPAMTVDHLCFNLVCVNPSHLELVTSTENTRRAWEAGIHDTRRRKPS